MGWLPILGPVSLVLVLLFRRQLKGWLVSRFGAPDPLKEAEVLMAYGRTAQAVAILEAALADHPERADIAGKLQSLKGRR
jgi:hypothetical protein